MTERQRGHSLLRLVCDYLQKNPEEELTRSDIAAKFNVQSSVVDSELKGAVNAGRLAVERNEDDGLVWRLGGPKVNSPAPFAAAERAAKSARRAKMMATLAVDLSAIKIEKGVIYQPPVSRTSQWNALFEQMVDVEDSFAIFLQAKHALAHAATQYRKKVAAHFRFSIRNVSETHCRIWRKA